jgi:hypothetical protein
MSKASSGMRSEYKRGELGKGVRGKYYARYQAGTNVVLLDDKVAKVFSTSDAVNQALMGLIDLAHASTKGRKKIEPGPL